MIEITKRDTAYKAVFYSSHLDKYYVSAPCRVDGGATRLAFLFGFENEFVDKMWDDIFTSKHYLDSFEEKHWEVDWVHIANLQFTGLTDKNGIEIYDGNIVSNGNYIAVVTYQAPSFVMKEPIKNGLSKKWIEFIRRPEDNQFQEVIGNIYENPELLDK